VRLRGFLERRPLAGPETVHLDVTNACNLDCITCWSYAPELSREKPVAWKRQCIEPALFFRLVREAKEAGAERIVLSGGGEPFTHPEIYPFVAAVKNAGLRLTLITNGTLCDFERLRALAVDQILLNMAAASAAIYVRYHPNQTEASFHTLCAGARLLAQGGITAVNLVQVVNRANFAELPEMMTLAADLGARSSFKVGDLPHGTERWGLSEIEVRRIVEELAPAARKIGKHRQVRHNLDAFLAQLTGARGDLPDCFAGYLYSRVHVDGRVLFCCAPIEAGHVDGGSFSAIWRSDRYAALRERLHARRWFEDCARCGKHDLNFSAAKELGRLREAGEL
jgi:MoaA/NifB/PqqE/SkfB family radical SAM enzyme